MSPAGPVQTRLNVRPGDASVPRMFTWCLRHLVLVLSLAVYSLLAPFGYVAFAIHSLLPIGGPVRRAQILQSIVRAAFAGLHHWLRWARLLDYSPGALSVGIRGPFIVIANHPSMTDTPAIMASIPHVCAVVRSDIYSRPLIRPMMRTAGYIDAGGKGVQAVGRFIESAKERFARGFSVLIFPEGTRSPPGGGIHSMSRVPFELSCRAGVPVVALAIFEDPVWLGRKGGFFKLPHAVPRKRLQLLDVFEPEDFQGDSRKMRRAVQGRYQELFGPPGSPVPPGLEPSSGVDLARPTG